MNTKIGGIVGKSEQEFLQVYKDEMKVILKELYVLRKRVDVEEFKMRKDELLSILTEERNYYRTEALRLDKLCRALENSNKEHAFNNGNREKDLTHLETIVLGKSAS